MYTRDIKVFRDQFVLIFQYPYLDASAYALQPGI